MPPSDDPRYWRERAITLLSQITGITDVRVRECVECIEAAAVAVVEKKLKEPKVFNG